MYRICIIVVVILLSSCASTKQAYLPVSSCPEPPRVEMPALIVNSLGDQYTTEQALKALSEDYLTLKAELQRAILLLDAYRVKP